MLVQQSSVGLISVFILFQLSLCCSCTYARAHALMSHDKYAWSSLVPRLSTFRHNSGKPGNETAWSAQCKLLSGRFCSYNTAQKLAIILLLQCGQVTWFDGHIQKSTNQLHIQAQYKQLCHNFSTTMAAAPPPPLQIPAIPFSPGFRLWTRWPRILAPDMPIGCPSDTAPGGFMGGRWGEGEGGTEHFGEMEKSIVMHGV